MKSPGSRVRRRDLLRLRRFGQELSAPARDRGPEVPGFGSGYDLLKASRPAMGSYFEVRLAANTPGGIELATRALDLVDELEGQLTVYRDDSELSRLNATAHLGPVAVEPGLFGLLERALAIGKATGGAYDITAGPLSLAWGFFKGPKRVPDPEVLADARARTGQEHLRLDPVNCTAAFDRAGMIINLGSIGKGYAIDRAADVIRAHWWPTSALVHGGRSSAYALGSPPGNFGGRWQIAVRNPFQPETPLAILKIRNKGLGTSGAAFQSFEAGGRVYGHIIDPRIGEPVVGPASVTVVAPTAADADALSTAFYLIGFDGAAAYVAEHPEIGAVFVERADDGDRPRVRTLGLTEEDFQRV